MNNCPNCGAPESSFCEDKVRGDTICSECGACLPDRILDEALEKRNFADSKKNHMRGTELDKHLGAAAINTVIGKGTGALQRAQDRLKPSAMSTSDRNLTDGFSNLRKLESVLNLPKSVVQQAKDWMADFERRKKKQLHGVRSEEFALAIVYLVMNQNSQGRTIKELCGVTNLPEAEIRKFIGKIQKALPERTRTHTSAKDFIPIIVRDTKSPFIVERFASEVISRALDHQCEPACNDAVNHLEGRRTSTLAAAACWLAIRKIGANVQPDDVSVCASISTGAMQQCARIIEAHWAAMFADQPGKNHLKILAEMKQKEAELAAKTGTPANSNNNAPDGEKK